MRDLGGVGRESGQMGPKLEFRRYLGRAICRRFRNLSSLFSQPGDANDARFLDCW